jgi:hypothetical protein
MHLKRTCAVLTLLLAACDTQPAPEQQPDPRTLPSRAETISDTLLIEGTPEPVTARLLQSPAGTSVSFSTYVPEGISPSFEGEGDTVSVRFAAAFSGVTDPNAYMHVRFYAADMSIAEARDILRGFLSAREPEGAPLDGSPVEQGYQMVEAPSWGQEAFSLSYRGEGNRMYLGHLVIATRRDRVFHVLTHYPAEYADGLGPRFDRILHHWRWDDDSEMLVRHAGPILRSQPTDTMRQN